MNVQHTERENNLWLVANLRKPAERLAAILKRPSNQPGQGRLQMRNVESIIIYYIATIAMYPVFYGFELVEAGAYSMATYFMSCAFVPLFCLSYIAYFNILDSQNATLTTKALSVVYFILIVNNVVMAIDAIEHMQQWEALDLVDTIINGSSDWVVPFGLADIVLLSIGVLCLVSRFGSLED